MAFSAPHIHGRAGSFGRWIDSLLLLAVLLSACCAFVSAAIQQLDVEVAHGSPPPVTAPEPHRIAAVYGRDLQADLATAETAELAFSPEQLHRARIH